MTVSILIGDCREKLRELPDGSVHCCVTSPPYFGLRDYGTAAWAGGSADCDHQPRRGAQGSSGQRADRTHTQNNIYGPECGKCGATRIDRQMGLEPTPDEFVAGMVEVFREVRRVLRDDGTLWLNIGDSYWSNTATQGRNESKSLGEGLTGGRESRIKQTLEMGSTSYRRASEGLKPKDLIGIPWMLARALRDPCYAGRIKRLEDRIWLAAMIDGEGCMFIHKRKVGQSNGQGYERKNDSYGSGLEVANCHRAIVERCQQITGVGSICEQSKDRRQTLYRWNVRSNECRWVIEEIYPHLVGKQHQARLLLGCPSSGEKADLAHRGLIDLHNGLTPAIDFPAPKTLYEPGWYLRQEIIWSKSNPMPESVRDRCTKAHEQIFLLSKSPRYYFDAEAIAEPATNGTDLGLLRGRSTSDDKGVAWHAQSIRTRQEAGVDSRTAGDGQRNKRSVWTVTTQPYSEAHFATYPPALIEPCILAGCPKGGTVLDPFGGAGTTGLVADRLGRNAILIELNPEYAEIARDRLHGDGGMFADVKLEAA